jgi:hypothetical protein
VNSKQIKPKSEATSLNNTELPIALLFRKIREYYRNLDKNNLNASEDKKTEEDNDNKFEKDCSRIIENIYLLENLYSENNLTKPRINKLQKNVEEFISKYGQIYWYPLYELQGLLEIANRNSDIATNYFREVLKYKSPQEIFISETGKNWENEQILIEEQQREVKKKEFRKKFWTKRKIITLFIIALIIAGSIFAPRITQRIKDDEVISNANPTILKLAEDSGMNRNGEILFLRADPQLVDSTGMLDNCSSVTSADNTNGFVTQGCYVPSTNNIYILQMPSALYDVEVTTAAYEMLHIVYNNLDSGSISNSLNESIQDNYQNINDSFLDSQVSNFTKIEPNYVDGELFSLLGTYYSGLSPDLAVYYSQYFNNIGIDISDNNSINQLFQNDENQLSQLQTTINNDTNLANTAYYDSTTWADVGNEYENNYNYNIYVEDFNDANDAINQYNQLLDQYNILVNEFNGKQFDPSTVQTQNTE